MSSLCWLLLTLPHKAGKSHQAKMWRDRETMLFGRLPSKPIQAGISRCFAVRGGALRAIFRVVARNLQLGLDLEENSSASLAAWRWFGGGRTATKKGVVRSTTANFLFSRSKQKGMVDLLKSKQKSSLSLNHPYLGEYRKGDEGLTTWRARRSPRELQCFAGGAVERRRQAGCDTAVLLCLSVF